MNRLLKKFFPLIIIVLCIIVFAAAISVGPSEVTLCSIFFNNDLITKQILLFRLLRIVLAFFTGAALAVSGCTMQALLKNPLAEPYTLGVSGGAALGASIAVITGSTFISVFAFCGGLLTVLIIFLIAHNMQFHPTAIILTGIALSFVLSSSVLLLFAFAKPDTVHKVLMWLWGDLSMARYEYIVPFASTISLLIIILLILHRPLDILSFGSQFATTHGITTFHVAVLFWVASLATSITVAIAGIIGFVGLIVPHAVRIINTHHSFVLPLSAIAGGTTLVIADTIGRTIVMPYEIPSGIITGFFGGIFFIILLITRNDAV